MVYFRILEMRLCLKTLLFQIAGPQELFFFEKNLDNLIQTTLFIKYSIQTFCPSVITVLINGWEKISLISNTMVF